MVCAVTPAVTAGAISGEKEKLTYEMLHGHPALSPASILWGKLISALSYVFLLLFAAVPLASLVFIFGGVAPRDMLKALVVLVVLAVSLGVLGLFMSALVRAHRAGDGRQLSGGDGPAVRAAAGRHRYQRASSRVNHRAGSWHPARSQCWHRRLAISRAEGGSVGLFLSWVGYWMSQAISPISQTSIPTPAVPLQLTAVCRADPGAVPADHAPAAASAPLEV